MTILTKGVCKAEYVCSISTLRNKLSYFMHIYYNKPAEVVRKTARCFVFPDPSMWSRRATEETFGVALVFTPEACFLLAEVLPTLFAE